MKIAFTIWFATCFSLFATPDWADNTNETYIGSNEKFYATIQTETDNQGSYYEWRIQILSPKSPLTSSLKTKM